MDKMIYTGALEIYKIVHLKTFFHFVDLVLALHVQWQKVRKWILYYSEPKSNTINISTDLSNYFNFMYVYP